jgi:hypothetical protein
MNPHPVSFSAQTALNAPSAWVFGEHPPELLHQAEIRQLRSHSHLASPTQATTVGFVIALTCSRQLFAHVSMTL